MSQLAHKAYAAASEFLDKLLETHEPRLHAALYPKRIHSPPNYLNPRHYGTCACASYRLWMDEKMRLMPHMAGMMISLAMSKYQVPTYFIEPAFAEAVMQSRLPDDFYLKDIKWPLPAMLFVLPDAVVQTYFQYYIPFIGVVKARAGNYPRDFQPYPETEHPIKDGYPLSVAEDGLLLHFPLFSTTEPPVDYFGNYPLNAPISSIKEGTFTDAIPYEKDFYLSKYQEQVMKSPPGPQNVKEDNELQINVTSFAIKLMLALTARPEYIGAERVARPENKNPRRRQDALYHPRMVGTPFRVLRPLTAPSEPTGRKMKMYWHPGGYTHQVIGKRADFISISQLPRTTEGKVDWLAVPDAVREQFWRSHKFIWIEPYLVNAPSADET